MSTKDVSKITATTTNTITGTDPTSTVYMSTISTAAATTTTNTTAADE